MMKHIYQFLLRLVRVPPAKWECRHPKQHELIWDGVSGRVVGMPYDSDSDHWVLVPHKYSEKRLALYWRLYALAT